MSPRLTYATCSTYQMRGIHPSKLSRAQKGASVNWYINARHLLSYLTHMQKQTREEILLPCQILEVQNLSQLCLHQAYSGILYCTQVEGFFWTLQQRLSLHAHSKATYLPAVMQTSMSGRSLFASLVISGEYDLIRFVAQGEKPWGGCSWKLGHNLQSENFFCSMSLELWHS